MTRLLLVEDHVMVRQSIRAFLTSEGIEVVGETGTGEQAVQLALDLNPDIVIMDVRLPDISGVEAARRICRQSPHMRVIALTAYNEKAYQRALIEAGADAFVLKTAELSELLEVIRSVMANAADAAPSLPPPGPSDAPATLTEREAEVLTCAARGWTNKQIGNHLRISDRTVQVHLQTIYGKLNVTNRTEAVLRALALGLIAPPIDGSIQ